jgi:uncharacterized protein YjeT (DUF2065 family)
MNDLIVGLGLVFVIEGLLWALAPRLGMDLLQAASATPQTTLRTYGCIAVVAGAAIVWLIRG